MKPYYQDDLVTLYHGDCREVLPGLEPVRFVVTDPPYGIDYVSRWDGSDFGDSIYGDRCPDPAWVSDLQCEVLYCFTRWDVLREWQRAIETLGLDVRDVLVWDKLAHGAGDPTTSWAPCHELIIYASKSPQPLTKPRPQNVLRHARVDAGAIGISTGQMMVHPSQKPEGLISAILGKHDFDCVLDPFIGSGTTLVAAKRLGRKSIGIEINEAYCEIAANRLRQGSLSAMFQP